MNRRSRRSLLWGLVVVSVSAISARSAPVTGNPNADGWTLNGNSLSLGTFVYTNSTDYNKLFNFDVYSTSFSLESGSNLIGSGWQAGDQIVGIGAVVHSGPLTDKVRILAKYGADDTTFQASSFAPANPIPPKPWNPPNAENPNLYGDGTGSSKYSGTGGVVIETPQIWGGDTPWFNPTGEGNIVTLDGSKWPDSTGKVASVTRYVSQVGSSITTDGVAKLIYQLDSNNLLSSFETYLNLSQLVRLGYTSNPAPGDRFVLAMQNQASDFTKATGQNTPVPEPSSLVLAAMGLGGLGLAYRRRRS